MKNKLKEAAEIIQNLKQYGMIRCVKGVVYPEGSHKDFLKKADEWLDEYYKNN